MKIDDIVVDENKDVSSYMVFDRNHLVLYNKDKDKYYDVCCDMKGIDDYEEPDK